MLRSLTSRRLATSNKGSAILRAVAGNSSTGATPGAAAPSTNAVVTRPISTASCTQQQQRSRPFYSSKNIVATPQTHYRRWLSDAGAKPPPTEEEKKEKDEANTAEDEASVEGDTDAPEEEGPSETDKLKEELAEMKNQLLRSLAEQENIRSIARRDVAAAKNFSVKSFAKSMLEVADNLDRALESVDQEEASKNDTLKTFVEGIEMTGSGLSKALKSNGVEAFCEQPGEEFDAEKHQALMEYEDPKATLGTVGLVMKKGYMLNGRVLRAAEVGVVKK